MFGIRLQQLFFVCDKIITRNLRNKRFDGVGPNPGLDKRIRAFKKEGLKPEYDQAEEFIESSDSDFSNVGESYKKHINETLIRQHDLRHQIVKEKYFKENMPNLLTWSEKEQIRHLATTEPDQWPPERIAESFPVTAQVAKKLLKYPWKPATLERITRHDASVVRNWKELKEGSSNIPDDLRERFLKFSERKIPPLNKASIKIDLTHEKKIGEFAQIVQRCAANESQHSVAESPINSNINEESSKDELTSLATEKMPPQYNNRRVTLSELTENIQNTLDRGNSVDINDEIIIQSVHHSKDSDRETVTDIKDINLSLQNKGETQSSAELVEYENHESNNKNMVMDYPERIRIPKKLYKRGATYKVNDCYYDHDGKFLYRVLGMGV